MMDAVGKILSVTGYSWQELVGMGIVKLCDSCNAKKVRFKRVGNGFRISIACDDEAVDEAEQIWDNHVVPELEGDKT